MTRDEIEALLDAIEERTCLASDLGAIREDPDFRRIVAAGSPILPDLLSLLQDRSDWALPLALVRIAGPKAVVLARDEQGRIGSICARWLTWGRQNGLIPG